VTLNAGAKPPSPGAKSGELVESSGFKDGLRPAATTKDRLPFFLSSADLHRFALSAKQRGDPAELFVAPERTQPGLRKCRSRMQEASGA
jgi:hypothetical protein